MSCEESLQFLLLFKELFKFWIIFLSLYTNFFETFLDNPIEDGEPLIAGLIDVFPTVIKAASEVLVIIGFFNKTFKINLVLKVVDLNSVIFVLDC